MYWLAFAADVSCGIPHSHRHMDIGLIYTNRFSGTMQKSAAIDGDTSSYFQEEHFKIKHISQCPNGQLMNRKSASVVVIGGAIIGSFVAYFLRKEGFQGSVTAVEKDSTYQFSSTALSAASIRTQFGCPFNIEMSLFSANIIKNAKERSDERRVGKECVSTFKSRGSTYQ